MKKTKKIAPYSILKDACIVAGFLMLGYGLYAIYPPAMYLVMGITLIWLGWPDKGGGD